MQKLYYRGHRTPMNCLGRARKYPRLDAHRFDHDEQREVFGCRMIQLLVSSAVFKHNLYMHVKIM